MSARSDRMGTMRAAALLTTVSLAALLAGATAATAQDCAAHAAPPENLATPSMLYDALRTRTSAQLLAIGFVRKPVAEDCDWIYEVRVLTASGSVVELDFNASGLDLVGARGPQNDRDAAALVKNFGGDAGFLTAGAEKNDSDRGLGSASGGDKGSGGSGGHGGGDDSGGGEGGGSGSGGGNSGPGGGDSGEGGNSGPGGGGGGGGDSGSGGEGGEGGSDHSGSGGGDD